MLLGAAVLSFIVYTARAEGDDYIGQAPPALPQPSAEMPEQPDIILITVDTLRADRLGVYGYAAAQTPNIDAIGRSGIVFANATVPLPRTTPGLASLLTGLGTDGHGSREVWEPVDVEDGQRLAEILSAAGYATFGLSANSAAGKQQGLGAGFDKFLDYREIKRDKKRGDADVMTSVALDMIDEVDPETPVFLWVHYVDPHWKYGPPRKKWRRQPSAKACRSLQAKIKRNQLSLGNMFVDADGIATDAFDDCSDLYDAEVAFTDREIGRLIEGLQELGRWDDALRVFTADHGENMGEDGLYFAHGPSLADAALRVPLMIAGPTIPAGRYDGGIALIEDVVPTLLDLAQIDEKLWPEFDGSSLHWRWNDDIGYPSEVASLAVAESGGALHPDTTAYIVSGRQKSKYCYNGPRYSMCFDPKDLKRSGLTITPGGEDEDEDDHDEDEDEDEDLEDLGDDEDDEDEDEDEDDVGSENEDDEEQAPAPAQETPASAPVLPADQDVFEFYDRQTDPLLKTPLESIPEDAKAQLFDAKQRWSPESTRLRAVRDTNYKLVAYPKLEGGYNYALYDLKNDPAESKDIKESSVRVYKRMRAALDDWGNTMPTFVARERSESELDELRALGYVQ